ncbi:MAG TPA: hypothetical protein VNX28_11400, partial [Gemmataceae bacterium]|nr:hypothetical protein [Gemmataceae bacterium]
WVLDASAPPHLPPPGIRVGGVIINKVDLPAVWEWSSLPSIKEGSESCPCQHVSCKTGQGVTELCQWIASLLGLEEGMAANEGLAFTPELCDQIVLAHEAARAANWERVREIVDGISIDVRDCAPLTRSVSEVPAPSQAPAPHQTPSELPMEER